LPAYPVTPEGRQARYERGSAAAVCRRRVDAPFFEPMSTLPQPGRVAGVHGIVVDIDFPAGRLPAIGTALVVERPSASALTVEVHARPGGARDGEAPTLE